jgi:hypothetical protein
VKAFSNCSLQVEEREGVFYSLESGHKLEWHSEENWCFKLSSQRENILNWLSRGGKSPVQPVQFLPQVREQAEQPEGEYPQLVEQRREESSPTCAVPAPGERTS